MSKLDCGHERDGAVGIVHLGNIGKKICVPCHDRAKRAAYKPEVLRRERGPLKVGMTTLVGVMGFATVNGPCPKCGHDHVADRKYSARGDGVTATCMVNNCGAQLPVEDPFPLKHGNCCGVINMCTENVEEALKRWPELAVDCEFEIVKIRDLERKRVVDDRLPDEWKKHHCSSCGYYEDDSDPIPYREGASIREGESTVEQGYVYAPYVPVLKEPKFDITEFEIRGRSRELKTKWSTGTINEDYFDRGTVKGDE